MNASKLASIKVERRSLGVAVFVRDQLTYTQARQLASRYEKAEASALGFVRWVITMFEIDSAALEQLPSTDNLRRLNLTANIVRSLRADGVTVWEVSKQTLFDAFGMPPLRSRRELRGIIRSLWPVLPAEMGNGSTLDATALGLYVQIERKFSALTSH